MEYKIIIIAELEAVFSSTFFGILTGLFLAVIV